MALAPAPTAATCHSFRVSDHELAQTGSLLPRGRSREIVASGLTGGTPPTTRAIVSGLPSIGKGQSVQHHKLNLNDQGEIRRNVVDNIDHLYNVVQEGQ